MSKLPENDSFLTPRLDNDQVSPIRSNLTWNITLFVSFLILFGRILDRDRELKKKASFSERVVRIVGCLD